MILASHLYGGDTQKVRREMVDGRRETANGRREMMNFKRGLEMGSIQRVFFTFAISRLLPHALSSLEFEF